MAFRPGSKGGASRVLSPWLLAAQAALGLVSLAPAHAAMLNANDAAPAQGVEYAARFDNVGRIECLDNRDQTVRDIATGWVIGSADTVITAAHLLFKRGAEAEVIAPDRCVFVLFDSDRRVRQIVKIRYGLSPWRNQRQRDDTSFDVAVLKLERPAKVVHVPAVRIADAMAERSIELVAFHLGAVEADRALVTSGQMTNFPTSQQRFDPRDLRITDATRLFSSSADSTPGSSGGMYYDERRQAAVGVHVGSLCDQTRPSYAPGSCFNFGIRFDARIAAMVDSVVRDQPRAQLVIIGDEVPAFQLAMADRHNG